MFKKKLFPRSTRLTGNFRATELVHSPRLAPTTVADIETDAKSFGKKFAKDVIHLTKTEGDCSFNAAVAGSIKLRELHKEMDHAVLAACGWTEVQLRHVFSKCTCRRTTASVTPSIPLEILKRLSELNQ